MVNSASTVIYSTGPPLSSFKYDNKYNISVFSLDLLENKPLNKIIRIGNRVSDIDISSGVGYSKFDNLVAFTFVISEPAKAIKGMDLIIEKDKIIDPLIENDSVICYYLPNSSGFKLKYLGDSYSDVIFKTEPNQIVNFNGKTNIGLIIKKQNKKLVIAAVSKKNNVVPELSENVLLDLINGENQ
ncbi:hypothetical protein ACR79M_00430 [Sphingobacterium spiritivorum]|uniref:hypothetical protein n=1 Tax=Sphingobacterium spiritivorum TaxID=258 RepID=UPI003DA59715